MDLPHSLFTSLTLVSIATTTAGKYISLFGMCMGYSGTFYLLHIKEIVPNSQRLPRWNPPHRVG